ncbi:MAG TPA: hypothetical protein VLS25_04245 [Dehalococcoidia bacterium]|nr:hypothetical protein [Dehalococcoidia bacterium]
MALRWVPSLMLMITALAAGMMSPRLPPVGATFPGANGKIAFVRYLSGGSHIFVMNLDGSEVTQLTESPGYDSAPAWSPDGTKIAFTRVDAVSSPGVQGQYDIAVINADGSGLTMLTDDPGIDQDPAWSPDGGQIAFASYRDGVENFEIFVMASDGNGLRQLTNAGDGYVSASPSWSPDGATIVFVRGGQTITSDICTMRAEGGGEVNLTSTPQGESSPDWSPDGSTIVFTRESESFGSTIYSVGASGGYVRPLVAQPAGEGNATWSPDGTKIAFVAGGAPVSNSVIWVMNADGSERVRLTDGFASDDQPAWQPQLGDVALATPRLPAGTLKPSLQGSSAQGCVPVSRQGRMLPVEGGPPDGGQAWPYNRVVFVFGGLLLAAGGFLVLRAGLIGRG